MIFPDLREVIKSLAGESNLFAPNKNREMGFQWLGLRQSDYSRKCVCQGILGTSDSPICSRCMSTGYLFTDLIVKGYTWMGVLGSAFGAAPGLISTQQRNVVVKHDRPISKFDFILELEQHPDTNQLVLPLRIHRYFQVQDALPIKGDDSKVEFWKVSLEERNIKDGRPGKQDTSFTYGGNRSNQEPS